MKFSFFGSVRNDWIHAKKILNSIKSIFWFASKEVVLIDDGSHEKEAEHARSLEREHPGLSIIFNSQHQGIVPCLNQAIDIINGDIAIPISADMEYVSRLFPFALIYAFGIRHADFIFAKTVHTTLQDKVTGVTGWSSVKGLQPRNGAIERFVEGKTRPSGWSVAFRTTTLKNYQYPELGSLSDFYLNNIMILKHQSYYWSKKVVTTLERKNSFSSSFSPQQNRANLLKTIDHFKAQGIPFSESEIQKILRTENLDLG